VEVFFASLKLGEDLRFIMDFLGHSRNEKIEYPVFNFIRNY